MNTRKIRAITYWATTAIMALDFCAGGVASLLRPPAVLEGMAHLGYPAYLALLLGAWKVLGAIAIVAPRRPLLKEWAYAGIFFDLTGAAFSHASSGDGPEAIVPLVFLGLTIASWALRPQARTLRVPAPARAPRIEASSLGSPAVAQQAA